MLNYTNDYHVSSNVCGGVSKSIGGASKRGGRKQLIASSKL